MDVLWFVDVALVRLRVGKLEVVKEVCVCVCVVFVYVCVRARTRFVCAHVCLPHAEAVESRHSQKFMNAAGAWY